MKNLPDINGSFCMDAGGRVEHMRECVHSFNQLITRKTFCARASVSQYETYCTSKNSDTKVAYDNKYHGINDVDYNYCLSFQGELKREKKPKYNELCSFDQGKSISHGSQIVH